MKTIIRFLTLTALAAVALCASGCVSTSGNLNKFLAGLPAVTATDITQTTTTPVYSHSESASGITTAADGTLVITNGKASASIPELGVTWSLNASGITIRPRDVTPAPDAPAVLTVPPAAGAAK